MPVTRHYFPGNNTPRGFFSYYRYILDQKEAAKILCIKGGPGTGKSTLLKRLGESFQADYNVDYLHCSADDESFDGIIIRDKNIAVIDGTSPHIVDPITPGAVDSIVNLGEYWNDEMIKPRKGEIININEKTSENYKLAYSYFSGAENLYGSLETIYSKAVEASEVYKISEEIIRREYAVSEVKVMPGRVKKFFASAITANGYINYIPSLLKNMDKIYMLNSPIGYNNNSFMEVVKEGALYRGYDVECYYCPMKPSFKIEHMLIPELNLAFVTTNKYHDVEPWQIFDEDSFHSQEIVLIDLNDYMNASYLISMEADIEEIVKEMDQLLGRGIEYLRRAKAGHKEVEGIYTQSMNFSMLDKYINTLIMTLK